jgi:phospholipase C
MFGTRRYALCVFAVAMTVMMLAAPAGASTPTSTLPPIHHVWLIMLENHSFAENFGAPAKQFKATPGSPASMSYMASTLPSQGALLTNYFGVAHPSNANYTALLSG